MRLVQFLSEEGSRRVGVVENSTTLVVLQATDSVYGLAHRAAAEQTTLAALAMELAGDGREDYPRMVAEGRLLVPLDHPVDPARCRVTGTGITHVGADRAALTARLARDIDADSEPALALLQAGLRGGKPAADETGAQPEWFYKGDGEALVASEQPLVSPAFALDGSDEAELAALYVVDGDGNPCRVGYALANEFTDHLTEHANVLYLEHAKLRPSALGPELLLGELPAQVAGQARVRRDGAVIWQQDFLSGEDHMVHSLANLEYHHFKYPGFRRPGDVHVHMLGAAAQSYASGLRLRAGDVMEVESATFGRTLRNTLAVAEPLPARIRRL